MNKKLLEILVCPFDKVSSLDLIEFKRLSSVLQRPQEQETILNTQAERTKSPSSDSELGDSQDSNTKNVKTSSTEEHEGIVEEGLLLCKTCFRFYPIIEEIPIILPDDLRDKKKDIEFLKKWKGSVPQDLLGNLKPWTI